RDSDRAVNDDDTYSVPGLQVVFYNDGTQGRSRLVLQLAGVQAESRYGIFLLPSSSDGTDAGFATDFSPLGTVDAVGFDAGPAQPPSLLHRIGQFLGNAIKYPAQATVDALRLIVTNPREFGVLFVMWSLIASPIYLAIRRRFLARGLSV
ncbi:MAG: hypothetical protein ABR507_01070, partial [Actinomycetota bacterium]